MIMQRLFILLLFIFPTFAYEITGKVVKVTDGDTVHILDDKNEKHKIRLADIDSPERKQPFGKQSKQMLSRLIFGKIVVADCTKKDRYKRDICTIIKGNVNINATMVASGGAWVYRKYYKGSEYYDYENQAKSAGRGLWKTSEYQAVPPWEWRKK